VLASGGVGSLAHVKALRETGVIAGVVIGKALLDRVIDLEEAIETAR
jgi:phosphoribosylformimino-5-aminoimidazole carboxamide ribotide isomerase